MGKKTVKVKYSEDIPKSSMFCQDEHTLLNIYGDDDALTREDLAIGNMYGCVIRPLEHSEQGYFFYRKDLGNGEMLICGECYPVYNKQDYDEAVYYLDEDHPPHTVRFIEEDSLTDDDDFTEEEKEDIEFWKGIEKMEESVSAMTDPVDDYRVYVISVTKTNLIGTSTADEAFIAEAEKQGSVYSLKKFEDALNYNDIDIDNSLVRIIKQ